MKQKIKDFLFKKIFFKEGLKILKKKKGFSLLEVLVAVSIIGIITAIAIPAFQDYRATASKTAGDTSIGNIGRAYQNCMVLKQFSQCNDLGQIGITCADCTSAKSQTGSKFCAQIEKDVGGETFKACIEFDGSKLIRRSYGGDLFKDLKICHNTVTNCTGAGASTDNTDHPQAGAKECTADGDCTPGAYSCTSSGTATVTAKCKKVAHATAGICTAGICSK